MKNLLIILSLFNSPNALADDKPSLYIQELLTYNLIKEVAFLSVLITLIILFIALFLFFLRKYNEDSDSEIYTGATAISASLLGFSIIVLLFTGSSSIDQIIKIKFAPRVYIIEHMGKVKDPSCCLGQLILD